MSQPDPKRWAALWFIALAQFMVIMDTSIIAAISALAVSKGAGHLDDPVALTDGFSAGFLGAAGIATAGGLLAFITVRKTELIRIRARRTGIGARYSLAPAVHRRGLGLGGDPATHGEADQPDPIEGVGLEPAVISREQPEVGPSLDALGGFLRRFRERIERKIAAVTDPSSPQHHRAGSPVRRSVTLVRTVKEGTSRR
ncbi:hypothetical protein BH18ACT3_BH18ACT3_24850 [soil metagenome]